MARKADAHIQKEPEHGKRYDQKMKPYLVLQYLMQYTDENNVVTAYDILAQLYERYGCNMQFGGDDQWSNMLGGTDLIRRKLGKDAYAMTITLLMNSEGKKMGKTQKGAVWLDPNKTSPFEFYQYWRNVDDSYAWS